MLSDFAEAFIVRIKASDADGYGGTSKTRSDGQTISASICSTGSAETNVGAGKALNKAYTILHDRTIDFKRGDVLKRVSDGKEYRVTSDSSDMRTPIKAGISFAQVTAEVIE